MDIDDGRDVSHDFDGSDHDDVHAARRSAIKRLAQAIHDDPAAEGDRNFRVDLRNERRKVILRATLSLRSIWIEPN